MKLIKTKHAISRMEDRDIDDSRINNTVKKGKIIEEDDTHIVKKYKNTIVVLSKKKNIIITAYKLDSVKKIIRQKKKDIKKYSRAR